MDFYILLHCIMYFVFHLYDSALAIILLKATWLDLTCAHFIVIPTSTIILLAMHIPHPTYDVITIFTYDIPFCTTSIYSPHSSSGKHTLPLSSLCWWCTRHILIVVHFSSYKANIRRLSSFSRFDSYSSHRLRWEYLFTNSYYENVQAGSRKTTAP